MEPALNAFSVHILIEYPLFLRYVQHPGFYGFFFLILFCLFNILNLIIIHLLVIYSCEEELDSPQLFESTAPTTIEKVSEISVEEERGEKSKVLKYVIVGLVSAVVVAGLIFAGYCWFYRDSYSSDSRREDGDLNSTNSSNTLVASPQAPIKNPTRRGAPQTWVAETSLNIESNKPRTSKELINLNKSRTPRKLVNFDSTGEDFNIKTPNTVSFNFKDQFFDPASLCKTKTLNLNSELWKTLSKSPFLGRNVDTTHPLINEFQSFITKRNRESLCCKSYILPFYDYYPVLGLKVDRLYLNSDLAHSLIKNQ